MLWSSAPQARQYSGSAEPGDEVAQRARGVAAQELAHGREAVAVERVGGEHAEARQRPHQPAQRVGVGARRGGEVGGVAGAVPQPVGQASRAATWTARAAQKPLASRERKAPAVGCKRRPGRST